MDYSQSFFSDIASMLINGMGSNMFTKTGSLIAGIAPLFQACFGAYVAMLAFNYYNRGFDENVVDLAKKIIGWLIIISFAFNAGQYGKLADMLYTFPDRLSGLFGLQEYTASALDTSYNNLLKSISSMAAYAASLDFTQISDRLMLWAGIGLIGVFGGIFFLVTLAYYVIAKLSLAMVIMIGPLFIGSLLFPATRQWGMNWIGQILNYAITITFFTILGAVQQDFFTNNLQNAVVGDITSVAQVFALIPLFTLSTIFFILIAWGIPSIASALTGGASVNGFSRTLMSIYAMGKGKFPIGGSGKSGGSIRR